MKADKEKEYIKNLKKKLKFKRKSYNLFIEQLNNFKRSEEQYKLTKHSYSIGDDVILKKGTFMHGTRKVIME